MSDCTVPEFYNTAETKAKKVHKCYECSAPINIGETYLSCTGKWDGEVNTFKQHLLCADACEFIRDNFNGGDCIGFGDLFEHAHEFSKQYDKKSPDAKAFRKLYAQILVRKRNP